MTTDKYYSRGVTFVPACISNYTHARMQHGITYPFPNFNGATFEVWERVSDFIPYLIGYVISYPKLDSSYSMLVKGAPGLFWLASLISTAYSNIYIYIYIYIYIHTLKRNYIRLSFTHFPLDKMTAFLADGILKCIFVNENVNIPTQVSFVPVPMSPIEHKQVLVPLMAWRLTGHKPLPEPMMTQFTDTYMQRMGRWVNKSCWMFTLNAIDINLQYARIEIYITLTLSLTRARIS